MTGEPPSLPDSSAACPGKNSRSARNKIEKEKPSCAKLLAKINELMDQEKTTRGGTKGLIQRFRDYQGDDVGHGTAIENQQGSLAEHLRAYEKNGCGDPPSGAAELAQRPLPSPQSAQSSAGNQNAKTALEAGGAVTAGYIAYRVIRMIPSLFPPLWWTIPENVAIP
ncbi:MAG TPA: hypothetical protein PK677_16990 [Acidiphilium sp.]|nr:hypothetical protein [Acidiphilium sp.]